MELIERILDLIRAGGWVMWPLLALSLASIALTVERMAFWATTHNAGRIERLGTVTELVRAGDLPSAAAKVAHDRSVYGRYLLAIIARAQRTRPDGAPMQESYAHEPAELVRPAIERFGATMATIITAAPMLGILGTVTGIIRSFRLLDDAGAVTDPAAVAAGIGEALFTTAFGLIVALITLFPHAVFRAHADRCLARLEVLAATVVEATGGQRREPISPAERG
ncbi:MAG: hypothetical protein CMJ31_01995 [Phycisphaerae bacterium]|nr:hypothetical protein [Phycisphaerae bacterium]